MMIETMNQISTLKTNRILCLALGLTLALVCQQSVGQSAPAPPKVPAAVAKYQAQLERHKSQSEDLIERLKAATVNEKSIAQELEELKNRGDTLSVSADSYPEILKTIHSQRVQLSIDLAGLDARYDAIAIAITEATKKQHEAVLKPYKRLVEVREAKLKRLTENAATTSKENRDAAEVELLEARLRLAEASKPAGSLSHLNSQLLDTSLERAEKTARLEKAISLFKDVEEYRSFRAALEETQGKRQTITRLQQDISQRLLANNQRIESLEERLAQYEKESAESAE